MRLKLTMQRTAGPNFDDHSLNFTPRALIDLADYNRYPYMNGPRFDSRMILVCLSALVRSLHHETLATVGYSSSRTRISERCDRALTST